MAASVPPGEEWEECLGKLKEESAKLQQWGIYIAEHLRSDDIMSAPEVMDPKTDAGLNWKDATLLDEMIQRKMLPDVHAMSETETVDMMDVLLIMETLFLRGNQLPQTLYSCAFMHRLALMEQNKHLFAYARAIAKSVDIVLNTVVAADVREEEEFCVIPLEVDTLPKVETAVIEQELVEAINTAPSAAMKARLQFRLEYFRTLARLYEDTRESTLSAKASAQLAIQALADLTRTQEPKVDSRVFSSVPGTWLSAITPMPMKDLIPLAEAVAELKQMLQHYMALCGFLDLEHLPNIMEAVCHFGSLHPLLPVRSRAALLFCHQQTQRFAYRATAPDLVVETLANYHGAPLYLKLLQQDEQLTADVVNYRTARLMDSPMKYDASKIDKEQLKQQTIQLVQRWCVDAGKLYLATMHAFLYNRGRCHRRLCNLMPDLAAFQQYSWEVDYNIFCAAQPSGSQSPETTQEFSVKASVLNAFSNDIVYFVADSFLSLSMELDLLNRAEYLPVLWYRNFLISTRIENYTTLFVTASDPYPQRRVNKTTLAPLYTPALTTRNFVVPAPHLASKVDVTRGILNGSFLVLMGLQNHKLLNLDLPETSLVHISTVFDHRIAPLACFHRPRFVPWAQFAPQFRQANPPKLSQQLKPALDLFNACVEKCKALMADESLPTHQYFVAAERCCKANALALKLLLAALGDDPEKEDSAAVAKQYSFTVEVAKYPPFPTLSIKLLH